MSDLLPCPFCGQTRATAQYTSGYVRRVCIECGASTARFNEDDLALCDAAWNRRAKPADIFDGGWIACSERMPDADGEFIVVLNGDETVHGWLRDGAWKIQDSDLFEPMELIPPAYLNCAVTHWRPLPSPPAPPATTIPTAATDKGEA